MVVYFFEGNFDFKTNKLVYINPSDQVQIVTNDKEMTNHTVK